ncbi:MAG: HesA/MoeB/ThiF family protein [Parafilimonas sp.]
MNNQTSYERYQRQILLKEFGIKSQQKLLQSKVLVVGAGGLGCAALQYLVAAGVGTIGIVDDDIVSLTNLHRQVLYNMQDIGLSKAKVAADKLKALNDEIIINIYNERLTNQNAFGIINNYQIVVDGTDNFSSRYMINDACVLLSKPLVYAAISKFEGQLAVLNVKNNTNTRAINYRDLFPVPPKNDEILNCAEAGVLGILPGIIGTMQANETIKLITGIGEPLINKLLTYNALNNSVYEFGLSANEEAQAFIPTYKNAFLKMNYEWLCSSTLNNQFEIDTLKFDSLIEDDNTMIIDVREKNEQPVVDEFKHVQISLSELSNKQMLIEEDTIILFCQTGTRSLQAAKLMYEVFNQSKKIVSLKGGIFEWKKKHQFQEIK